MGNFVPLETLTQGGHVGSQDGVRGDARPLPSEGGQGAAAPFGREKPVELAPIHDFARKLRQPAALERLKEYVRWKAALRQDLAEEGARGREAVRIPDFAPVSINLDITTACNFACDHCVDMDILNTGIKYDHQRLLDSLELLAGKGLRSVIVIGGGEPTVYPKFVETVRFMKALGLQVAIVSNGSGMKKIAALVDVLEEEDWVRLSLDAWSDEVFQAMHKPKKKITLDQICEGVAEIREMGPRFRIGFSFIITWKGATIHDTHIIENLHEIIPAAERARRYGFDYIAYKPFLTRAERNNAEIVDLRDDQVDFDAIIERIRAAVDEAKRFETEDFKVYETTNLKVLENGTHHRYAQQPHNCHMQFFRQVLSPLGVYNCPVYRNQPHGRLNDKDGYSCGESFEHTREGTAERILHFDATHECREVTCLYNHANWWIEDLIAHPEKLETLAAVEGEPDYFL